MAAHAQEVAAHVGVPQAPATPAEGQLARELAEMQREPLLPVEKKLIGWSIGIGITLLGILVWVSYTFFPAGH